METDPRMRNAFWLLDSGDLRWLVAIAIRSGSGNPGGQCPTDCYLLGRLDLSQQGR